MTGCYCLWSLKKSHMSHHIIFITVCAQNVRLQHERYIVHMLLAYLLTCSIAAHKARSAIQPVGSLDAASHAGNKEQPGRHRLESKCL